MMPSSDRGSTRTALALWAMAVTLLPALLDGAALAQPAPGAKADDVAERKLHEFAACVVFNSPAKAQRVLDSAPGSADEERLLQGFAANNRACLQDSLFGSRLKSNRVWVRGAIAEASYASRFGRAAPAAATPVVLPAPVTVIGRMGKTTPFAEQLTFLYAVAACTVAEQPAAARAFVLAKIDSDEERAALPGIVPAIANCTPKDAHFSINRPMLHATLAESLYRWSAAQGGPASQPAR